MWVVKNSYDHIPHRHIQEKCDRLGTEKQSFSGLYRMLNTFVKIQVQNSQVHNFLESTHF